MERSTVQYLSSQEGYRCGYCNSADSSFSHGMWTHALTTLDYQHLIDRGWRRSGKYCYKPTMDITCCPLYTIRCEAKNCSLTRSQKKVLKKVYRFLAHGEKAKQEEPSSRNSESDQDMDVFMPPHDIDIQNVKRIKKLKQIDPSEIKADDPESLPNIHNDANLPSESNVGSSPTESPSHITPLSHPPSSVEPIDLTNKPQCRKAKDIRKEKKLQKLLKKGMSPLEAAASLQKKATEPKSLEDFLFEPLPPQAAHKLQLRLVPSDLENALFRQTFEEAYNVYKKYQMSVHKDPAEKCSAQQFTRFLVKSPFQIKNFNPSSRKVTYGSFHHQYWLDNKLIAVGVIDILPYCVSSVYFYYDPEYSFLSLGTYAALREIALTRELNQKLPELQYYYMGYYIHSCIKMRYKGQFVPSFLLCPETYLFHAIEKCKPKLENSKYSRFEEDSTKVDTEGTVNLDEVLILYDRTKMYYPMYKQIADPDDEDEVHEYAAFVGRKCYRRMLLYRDS